MQYKDEEEQLKAYQTQYEESKGDFLSDRRDARNAVRRKMIAEYWVDRENPETRDSKALRRQLVNMEKLVEQRVGEAQRSWEDLNKWRIRVERVTNRVVEKAEAQGASIPAVVTEWTEKSEVYTEIDVEGQEWYLRGLFPTFDELSTGKIPYQ